MNTILLLTDFSEAAYHAARYAARLTHDLNTKRLVIYHAYQAFLPVSEVNAFTQTMNMEIIHKTSIQQLEELKRKLKELVSPETVIDCRADETAFAAFINDIAEEEKADLFIMGTTGKSKLEKVLVGSNTMRVASDSRYPVLIVPPKAPIEPVKRIVFACDLEKVKETTPVKELKKVLEAFKSPLLVVNVAHGEKKFNPDTPINISNLHSLLEIYNPTFHYIDNRDTIEGIMDFSEIHEASLILMLTKSHGFFEGLFHRSTTKKMIYHTTIPLLLLHEHTEL